LHGFFFSKVWFSVFGFSGLSVVFAGSCDKAENPPETRRGCAVFS